MSYGAEQIKVLEGLEAVRKRPGMYIGDTGKTGFHHMLWEIVDNSIDEHLAGYCRSIWVGLDDDGSAFVEDDGRGIPVAVHPQKGISALTLVLTVLHAGGKFENESGESGYKVSGGLHGVGASVVNALSEYLVADVWRDGFHWRQTFKKGVPVSDVERLEESAKRGTRITFLPDRTIFKDEEDETEIAWDQALILERLREKAYLNPGLRIVFGKETLQANDFGAILDVFAPQKRLATLVFSGTEQTTEGDVAVDIAMAITPDNNHEIRSFANNIRTPQGGTHEQGLKTAYLRFLNKWSQDQGLVKEAFGPQDVREGFFAAVSVKLVNPRFAGQTKDKLSNSAVSGAVAKVVGAALATFFEENPKEARAIIERIKQAQAARLAAEKARVAVERKSALSVGTLPGKLADCQSNDPNESELFIVEGDSAGGSAKQGRDRRTQAILPLKGKPLNVWRADAKQILSNAEITSIVQALGLSFTKRATVEYDSQKLRYGKVILLADADVDGAHITTLIATFFHTMMPQIIEEGRLFVACPPLYRARKGSKHVWIRDDAELSAFQRKHGAEKWEIQRFKGLGEMNPEELWETTMNPRTRVLVQVMPDDEAETTTELLMGKSVPPRRAFIEENARFAEIDI